MNPNFQGYIKREDLLKGLTPTEYKGIYADEKGGFQIILDVKLEADTEEEMYEKIDKLDAPFHIYIPDEE